MKECRYDTKSYIAFMNWEWKFVQVEYFLQLLKLVFKSKKDQTDADNCWRVPFLKECFLGYQQEEYWIREGNVWGEFSAFVRPLATTHSPTSSSPRAWSNLESTIASATGGRTSSSSQRILSTFSSGARRANTLDDGTRLKSVRHSVWLLTQQKSRNGDV